MIKPKFFTIITSLTGQSEPTDKWSEPHGCLQTVVNSPAPGFLRNVMLGSEGLQIRHGDHLVAIPLRVILELAEKAQPGIAPPSKIEQEKAITENAAIVQQAIQK